jgi:hypothetical protein
MIGIAMSAPFSISESSLLRWRVIVIPDGLVMLNFREVLRFTLFSMESSSSGVALTAGAMLAPALAEATAVPDAEGEGAGVGDAWPNAVKTSAIEQRQVKIVVFISVLWE